MTLALMQPYLFPYMGYFQLINAVDKFVIYDDAQYIKRGWINRNRILSGSTDFLFSFSIKKAPHTLNINQRFFANSFKSEKEKFAKTLHQLYRRAPNFSETMNLIENILDYNNDNVAIFIANSLSKIIDYLDMDTFFVFSSTIVRKVPFKREENIVYINQLLGADHYINLIGGRELYSKEYFREKGIKLSFLKMKEFQYKQFTNDFVPQLSIIDILMFNDKQKVQQYLGEYELI
ncbi:MAG: WbqC family protein [Candidatus Omnitrophica bacterium]|nr:WbqC family protein [Candidatus Omnitrophota bacterium]